MITFARKSLAPICLAVAVVLGVAGQREAAAQYAVASPTTTSVVAYQPVVVPTDPALISGWYPGKLLDTWAANRRTYRAVTAAPVAAPVTSYRPVTTYRPVSEVAYRTSYLPVRAYYRSYRPLFGSPYVATTAYQPVLTTSAVGCDTCATTVTNYAVTGSACCGATSSGPMYGEATQLPYLSNGEVPTEARRPEQASNGEGGTGTGDGLDSKLQDGGEQGDNQDEQDPANSGASFTPPPLRDLRLETSPADANDDKNVARNKGATVQQAVYTEPVQPRLAGATNRSAIVNKPQPAMPSRAEREAMWTPVER